MGYVAYLQRTQAKSLAPCPGYVSTKKVPASTEHCRGDARLFQHKCNQARGIPVAFAFLPCSVAAYPRSYPCSQQRIQIPVPPAAPGQWGQRQATIVLLLTQNFVNNGLLLHCFEEPRQSRRSPQKDNMIDDRLRGGSGIRAAA